MNITTKILFILMLPAILAAQLSFDPQSTAMANSTGASARGIRAAMANPALLAIPFEHTSQLSLINVQANISNNAFSNNDYLKYFASGDYLTPKDKKDLLGLIPANGIEAFVDVKTSLLGLYSNGIAVNFLLMGSGELQIPKNLFNVILNGNDINKNYQFTDASGESWSGLGASISYATRLAEDGVLDFPFLGEIDFFSIGGSFTYIYGIAYGKMTSASGEFITLPDRVQGKYSGVGYVSEGGNGYALDLGTAISIDNGNIVLGLSVKNLMGGIKWHNNNRRFTIDMLMDSVNTDNFSDEAFNITDSDTSYHSFYTFLPTTLDLGASWKFSQKVLFTFEYEQALRTRMGADMTPRMGFGTELRYVNVLPYRFGLSFGGKYGFSIGTGFSLDLNAFVWDFGLANHGGFFGNSAKGLSMATGMTFQF